MVQFSHPYMTTGKTITLTRSTFVGKVTSLLFNMLSHFIITFLPKSKHLLISWLQSPSAVILGPRKLSLSLFPLFPHLFAWSDETGCHDLCFFECMVLSHPFHSSLTFIKRLFSSSLLSAIRVVSSAYPRLLIFPLAVLIPAVLHPAQHFAWCILDLG